jgi:hypothetical protein
MKQLDAILGIGEIVQETASVPAVVESSAVVVAEPEKDDAEFRQDFETSRQNILSVIQQANEAIPLAMEIAKEREDPRSFEALTSMLKLLSETSKDLLAIRKAKKDVTATEQPTNLVQQTGGTTIQNAIFTGTASELLDAIATLNKKKD